MVAQRMPNVLAMERSTEAAMRLHEVYEKSRQCRSTSRMNSFADVDKVAETQCSGYTADYTRCYLPAGAGPRGGLVDVECLDLHADGIACGVRGHRGLSS